MPRARCTQTPPAFWILPGTVAPIPSVFIVCLLGGGCGKEEVDWTSWFVQDLLPNLPSPPNPRVTGRIFCSLEPPHAGVSDGPFCKEPGKPHGELGPRTGERWFMFLMKEAGRLMSSCRVLQRATHRPLGGGVAQDPGGQLPGYPTRLRNPDLHEGKCKLALPSALPAEGGFSVCEPGFLYPQPKC